MTVYAVIKIFDTLAEADRFAEQVTEDDIVAVFPIESPLDEGPVLQEAVAAADHASSPPTGFSSSGPPGLPPSLTAGESARPAPETGWYDEDGRRVADSTDAAYAATVRDGKVYFAPLPRPDNIVPFPGNWSVKA